MMVPHLHTHDVYSFPDDETRGAGYEPFSGSGSFGEGNSNGRGNGPGYGNGRGSGAGIGFRDDDGDGDGYGFGYGDGFYGEGYGSLEDVRPTYAYVMESTP